jgi:hypothetical protein
LSEKIAADKHELAARQVPPLLYPN